MSASDLFDNGQIAGGRGAACMNVFFYGLFMDEALLGRMGILPRSAATGYVDGLALHIGERATLLPCAGARAYGVMMDIACDQVQGLYGDKSVAEYVPEPVQVELQGASTVEAVCYNLPAEKVAGANKSYALSLLAAAEKLGFPESYLNHIRQAGQ